MSKVKATYKLLLNNEKMTIKSYLIAILFIGILQIFLNKNNDMRNFLCIISILISMEFLYSKKNLQEQYKNFCFLRKIFFKAKILIALEKSLLVSLASTIILLVNSRINKGFQLITFGLTLDQEKVVSYLIIFLSLSCVILTSIALTDIFSYLFKPNFLMCIILTFINAMLFGFTFGEVTGKNIVLSTLIASLMAISILLFYISWITLKKKTVL